MSMDTKIHMYMCMYVYMYIFKIVRSKKGKKQQEIVLSI